MLALNIVNRTFSHLVKPLDYLQAAPLGFLMVERLAVQAFGGNEYALRLFPFLCGVLSLFLFYRLAKLCLTPGAIPIGLGLFAVLGPVIYYSSEVKQYSSDVAVAVLLSTAAIYCKSRKLTPIRIVGCGVLGALSIWLSHTSMFVLAGTGTTLALFCWAEKRWERIKGLAIIGSAWALSFGVCYLISLRHLDSPALQYVYRSSFVPYPILSIEAAKWFAGTFFEIFRSPVGLELAGVGALTFLIGCISMSSHRREEFSILMAPILLALLAAVFHKYPFGGRLLLFIVPALLLFIAEGAEQIRSMTRDQAPIIGASLIGLLFFHPVLFSTYYLIKPGAGSLALGIGHDKEEIKPVMRYVEEHKREGDILYVLDPTIPAFLFYAPKYRLDKMNYVLGKASGWTEKWEDYEEDIDQLRSHRRVWFLFSHLHDQEKFLSYLLDRKGTKLDSFKGIGAAVYLYDFDCSPAE